MTTPNTRENYGLVVTTFLAVLALFVAIWSMAPVPWQVAICLSAFVGGVGVCIIAMTNQRDTDRLARWLRATDFADLYLIIATPVMRRLWNWCAPELEQDAGFRHSLRAALNCRLYDRALLIAVIYPVTLLFLPWYTSGAAVTLAGAVIVPAVPRYGAAHVTALCILSLFLITGIMAALRKYRGAQDVTYPDFLLYFSCFVTVSAVWFDIIPVAVVIVVAAAATAAVAAAVAVVVGGAVVGAAAIVGAAAMVGVAVAVAVAAVAVAVVVVVVVVVVVAVVVAVEQSVKKGHGNLAYLALTCGLSTVVIGAAIWLPWDEVSQFGRTIFIFFGLFPLLNAIFDTLSYAITLTLARAGLRTSRKWTIAYGFADLVVAIVLFAVLGVTLVSAVTGLSYLAGVDLLPLAPIIGGLSADPIPAEVHWVLLMVFSTLIPTLLHLSIAVLSLQALLPLQFRTRLADRIAAHATQSALTTVGAWITFGLVCALHLAAVLIIWRLAAFAWGPLTEMIAQGYLLLLGVLAGVIGV
ncbi:hypothetical protein [Loktanella sp. SALINAS62]|uniref:hypothetical protein n=1 Tax=Loktanella sp. SALINAS62 TaxID=2706124 RepID=UPI001B8B1F40|nr:hypothetical protein [Loktanella sp. SALINAS62]